MEIFGFHKLDAPDGLSFEDALKMADNFRGELCIVVKSKKKKKNTRAQAQFQPINSGDASRSFYDKHCDSEGFMLCILPLWFAEYLLRKEK